MPESKSAEEPSVLEASPELSSHFLPQQNPSSCSGVLRVSAQRGPVSGCGLAHNSNRRRRGYKSPPKEDVDASTGLSCTAGLPGGMGAMGNSHSGTGSSTTAATGLISPRL